jgi:hypothetical protein
VIMIRMTMTPIPVRPLFLHFDFNEGMVLSVPRDKVLTVVMVLVVFPIVVILVITVIDAVAIVIVTPVLLLVPVILPRGGVTHGRWHSQGPP